MTALWEYYKEAINLLSTQMGDYAPLTAAAAQTATAGSLAFGGNTEQEFAQWMLWRPSNTVTTEHERQADSWAPATGVFTHSGAAYTDTTATGETLLLIPPHFNVRRIRRACDRAIRQMREYDETEIPCTGLPWHWVHELDWIEDAASIRDVFWTNSPVITRNRYLQKRHSYSTAGIFLPDYWTVASNADTTPFEATDYRGQKYMYSMTRSTTNASLTQTVSAQLNGVSGAFPAGETITAVVVCDSNTAGDVLIGLDGAVSASASSATTALEELSCSGTLTAQVEAIAVGVVAQTNDATQKVYEAYACIGELTDAVRRDDFQRYRLQDYSFEQGGPLKIRNPYVGHGQLIIGSERSFPGFDSTRLASGAADLDESDAPLIPVATGIIAILMEGYLGVNHPDAKEWRRKFDNMKLKHMAADTDKGGGMQLLQRPFAASPMRVR